MSVSAIGTASSVYTGNVNFKQKELGNDISKTKKFFKKTGRLSKCIASGLIPGFGQYVDGKKKKGFIHFGVAVVSSIIAVTAGIVAFINKYQSDIRKKTPLISKVAAVVMCIAVGGYLANAIHSAIGTYKHSQKYNKSF